MVAPPVFAAGQRLVNINLPGSASAGDTTSVLITASTDVTGEQVGFLQAEYSIDGGKKWVSICYDPGSCS